MIYDRDDAAKEAAMNVAKQMMAAAVTAPKGCGIDNVEALILDGKEMNELAKHMHDIGIETEMDFFVRDAKTVTLSHCIVLIGVKDSPIQLEHCGFCGQENCANTVARGANCAFNIVDLGIAIGSVVSLAADNRIDNRVLYSAGKAALRMGCFSDNVKVCFGIPLSTMSKSLYYDRESDDSLLNQL